MEGIKPQQRDSYSAIIRPAEGKLFSKNQSRRVGSQRRTVITRAWYCPYTHLTHPLCIHTPRCLLSLSHSLSLSRSFSLSLTHTPHHPGVVVWGDPCNQSQSPLPDREVLTLISSGWSGASGIGNIEMEREW